MEDEDAIREAVCYRIRAVYEIELLEVDDLSELSKKEWSSAQRKADTS